MAQSRCPGGIEEGLLVSVPRGGLGKCLRRREAYAEIQLDVRHKDPGKCFKQTEWKAWCALGRGGGGMGLLQVTKSSRNIVQGERGKQGLLDARGSLR